MDPVEDSKKWAGLVSEYVTYFKTDDFGKMVLLYDSTSLDELAILVKEVATSAQEDDALEAYCRGMWGKQYELSEIKSMSPQTMLVGLLSHKTSHRPEGFTEAQKTLTYKIQSISPEAGGSVNITLRFEGEDVNGKTFSFAETITLVAEEGQWRLSLEKMVNVLRHLQSGCCGR